jgi:2-haloacid dehalogenase
VSQGPIDAVVFDLGNVVVRWDVRALYRKIFTDEAEMERFLAEVWTDEHNLRCDSGESFAAVTAEVVAEHPEFDGEIRAAGERWIETIPGPVDGTFDIIAELSDAGVPLYGLTNMSMESFPQLEVIYPQLSLLRHVVVSGQVGVTKPDPAIFEILIERTGVDPATTLFIDDSPVNTAGAAAMGFLTALFTDATSLRRRLADEGLPVSVPA